MQGYRRALARYPRITILQKQFAENSADKVSSIVRSTLAAHPDLGGIIADGDIVGEFTGATLSSLKRTDIPAVAFDATPAEQKWLASGALDGLVAWDPYALGYQGATVAFDLLARKPVPTSIPRQSYVFVSRRTMKDPQLGNHLYRYECTPKA